MTVYMHGRVHVAEFRDKIPFKDEPCKTQEIPIS